MEVLWHGLLVGCIFTSTVSCRAGEAVQPRANPNPVEYGDEIAAAEDHEHHRIVIVVPKEMPQHVNHVHTYKLAGKGIPLIHSGKVVHDHKHSGKVGHDHGHAGVYGHQHKHVGYLGHQHFGGKPGGGKHAGGGGGGRYQFDPHHPLLRSAAHKLHLQNQYQLQQQPQYLVHGARGRPATSGQLQYVPSSKPHGLGAFMPAEIKQYVEGHYNGAVPVQKQFQQQQFQQQQQQHQQLQHQQQQRFELEPDAPAAAEDVADVDDDDDGGGENQGVPPAPYNLIQLRVPEQHGHNVIKHVDIDLTNNVAKLKTGAKQPVTANYKPVPNLFDEHFPSYSTHSFQILHSL